MTRCLSLMPIAAMVLSALPMMAAQSDLLDLAAGSVVISYTSQYSDSWAALLLLDGTSKTGWSAGKPNPNAIVIELPQIHALSSIALDNTDAQETSYGGISARQVEIHVSTTSAASGFQKVATVEVPRAKRKEFPLADPIKARWLKLVILSNWGHAEFTELMEVEAYGKALESVKPEVSGVYRTNYAPMLLEQTGNNVYGCYGAGTSLSGSVNGRVLQLEWRQNEGRRTGTTIMVLSSGNEFLNGLWYEGGELGGLWFGNRDKSVDPNCTYSEDEAIGRSLRQTGRVVLYGIQFDSDSAKIRSESEQTLRLVADVLKNDPSLQLMIEGHTDSSNTDAYNLELSQKRAEAVVSWLVQNGIAAKRLTAQGFGESRPVSDNTTPQGRALNRRVEIARR